MYQTIYEAAQAIRSQQVTPIELVEQCLQMINRWENKIHAWVFIDVEYARKEALRLTQELECGQYRGWLHGIPLGVKDIFDVNHWPTAAGSAAWANKIAYQDAKVISHLRQAGAIFLGKTVTCQYAGIDPSITYNPWNLALTPGGSSSGSAAAVATLMCFGATATQTGGSTTRPASYCGVASIKPTYDSLSLNGILPFSPSLDHPGAIGRCVRDLEILWSGMLSSASLLNTSANELDLSMTSMPCFGRLHGLFEELASPIMLQHLNLVSDIFTQAGAKVINTALPKDFNEIINRHFIIMAVEANDFHRVRLKQYPQEYSPKICSIIEKGSSYSPEAYEDCLQHQSKLKQDIKNCFMNVDVLLTPATPDTPPGRDTTGDASFNSPWSYTGLPTISITTGQSQDGLPLAIQLIGKYGCELQLLRIATWCEKLIKMKCSGLK